MQCPHCDNDLQLQQRHGVEIDLCPACRGVWLDRGELDKIVERAGRFREVPIDDNDVRYRTRPTHPQRGSFWRELFD